MYRILIVSVLLYYTTMMEGQPCFDYIYEPPCEYMPLEFKEDVEPIWHHLVIDSTFIGYSDTAALYKIYYTDGMEQLSFDSGSFIEDNYLYSITRVNYDLDLSGYYIEKIDIKNGEKLWTIRTDLRHTDYREKVLDMKVSGDKFIMRGVRCVLPDSILCPPIWALGGRIDSYFFERKYDLQTGELLEYNTVGPEDEGAYLIYYWINRYFLIEKGSDSYDYLERITSREGGDHFTRVSLAEYGIQKSEKDTVISSLFNDEDLSTARFSYNRSIIQGRDGYIYYVNQLLYDEVTEEKPYQTHLIKLDTQYNIVKSFDINSLGLESYGQINIWHITESDKILIRGCMSSNLNLPCRHFYLIFDTDLNHLNTITARLENNYFSFSNDTEIIQEDNSIIAIDRNSIVPGHSNYIIYRLLGGESYDTIKELTVKERNWGGWINRAFQLEDGDLLLKFNGGCLIEGGHLGSWHPVWMRLDASDLGLTTSLEENDVPSDRLKIYPNPAGDYLDVERSSVIAGKLFIYNLTGQLLYSEDIENRTEIRLRISDYEPGHYVLKLVEKGADPELLRFIKM